MTSASRAIPSLPDADPRLDLFADLFHRLTSNVIEEGDACR